MTIARLTVFVPFFALFFFTGQTAGTLENAGFPFGRMPGPALAQAAQAAMQCPEGKRPCLLAALDQTVTAIDKPAWRDRAFREYAKILAYDGAADAALALIARIDNPDTKAMTIRGIAMAAADILPGAHQRAARMTLYKALLDEAQKIDHPPSHAIALTYISMAQAFAGDDTAAARTAQTIETPALRNKAFAENAEIQAENARPDAARVSLEQIDDPAFRNKAGALTARAHARRCAFAQASRAALGIDNPTLRAEALQFILERQRMLHQWQNRLQKRQDTNNTNTKAAEKSGRQDQSQNAPDAPDKICGGSTP